MSKSNEFDWPEVTECRGWLLMCNSEDPAVGPTRRGTFIIQVIYMGTTMFQCVIWQGEHLTTFSRWRLLTKAPSNQTTSETCGKRHKEVQVTVHTWSAMVHLISTGYSWDIMYSKLPIYIYRISCATWVNRFFHRIFVCWVAPLVATPIRALEFLHCFSVVFFKLPKSESR